MLIRKEKSNTSSLLTPKRSPLVKVIPLLEIPGRRANPWEQPIKKADFFVKYLFDSFLKSAINKRTAEIKNPQTNDFVEKLFSKNEWNKRKIITVGMVEMIKFKLVLLNGFLISSVILFL